MKYNVETNPHTGGFCCHFEHNGQKYWADLSDVPFCGPECMIFESDGEDVTNWLEEYANRDCDVTEDDLIRCIEDFKSQS